MFRSKVLTCGFLCLMAGCSGAPDERTGERSDDLYIQVNSRWNQTSLSVCWENLSSVTASAQTIVKNSLTATWQKATGIKFTGFGQCGAAGADVRVRSIDSRSSVHGTLGPSIRNVPNSVDINTEFVKWGDRCSCSPEGRAREAALLKAHPTWTRDSPEFIKQCQAEFAPDACIYSVTAHEFGHVLGFQHEQDRTDDTCPAEDSVTDHTNDAYYGAPDANSIMSYCAPSWNNDGKLSSTDKYGARLLYGWGTDQPVPGNFQDLFKSQFGVYRPSEGNWYGLTPGAATGWVYPWGERGDIALVGDYSGDGRADKAVFRPRNNTWWITKGTDNTVIKSNVTFGTAGAVPLAGDFDADGKVDLAYWTGKDAKWYARTVSGTTLLNGVQFGQRGDVPLSANFSGAGIYKTDLTLWRPGTQEWFSMTTAGTILLWAARWGEAGDIPVTGDFDGDHFDDMVVFRPSTGTWWGRTVSGQFLFNTQFGQAGDVPVPRDYDGNGTTDLGVYRPSTAQWFTAKTNGTWISTGTWGTPE
jgi:Metallo-peptidase family M12